MTFIEAAITILRQNNNKPMTPREIWEQISQQSLIKSEGKTPMESLKSIMLGTSNNSNVKSRSKKLYFTIVSKKPNKFIILDEQTNDVDFDLSDEEKIMLEKSVNAVKELNNLLA